MMEWQFQDLYVIGGYRLYECLLLDNMMLDQQPCPKGIEQLVRGDLPLSKSFTSLVLL